MIQKVLNKPKTVGARDSEHKSYRGEERNPQKTGATPQRTGATPKDGAAPGEQVQSPKEWAQPPKNGRKDILPKAFLGRFFMHRLMLRNAPLGQRMNRARVGESSARLGELCFGIYARAMELAFGIF